MSTEFYWVAVVLVTIVSVARFTRLLVIDTFPPIKYVRDAYENKTDGTGWSRLTMCNYCFAPWVALVVICTGLLAGVYSEHTERSFDNIGFTAWWIVNGWFAVAYLAAILVTVDQDPESH